VWLDYVILEVFSNHNSSMMHGMAELKMRLHSEGTWEPMGIGGDGDAELSPVHLQAHLPIARVGDMAH